MIEKFQNKYRITSTRLAGWNYASDAAYFIKICTRNREHFFGEINNSKMMLNEIGKMAEKYWLEISDHFPFVELGNFVVMPNHVHGILIIDRGPGFIENVEALHCNASTFSKISPKPGSISTIIRSYKSVVTKNVRLSGISKSHLNIDFAWQPRFHDHIIRNNQSFHQIQDYIEQNPEKWKEDRFHLN